MKKFCLAISILTFFSSCSNHHSQSERSGWLRKNSLAQNEEKFKRVDSRFYYKIRPTESMQAGIPKVSDYNFSKLEGDEPSYYNDRIFSEEIAPMDENGQYVGYFKIGNPYQLFGVSYVPQNYEDFEEIGIASWYGDAFHGKLTANGETYNMEELTAAHPTLPLPSVARITNLKNGKSVIVRVNDRGPFSKNRVIDVSEKTADILGFKDRGTTEVKVELLRNETDELLEKLKIKIN